LTKFIKTTENTISA